MSTRILVLAVALLLIPSTAEATTRHMHVHAGKTERWTTPRRYSENLTWSVKIGRLPSVFAEYGNRRRDLIWVYGDGVTIRVSGRNHKHWRFRVTNLSGGNRRVVIDLEDAAMTLTMARPLDAVPFVHR